MPASRKLLNGAPVCGRLPFALGACLGLLLPVLAAPVPPRNASSYRGNKVRDLTLQLRASSTTYDPARGDKPPKLKLTLTNHACRARRIKELETLEGGLRVTLGYGYVLRFKNGAVFNLPNAIILPAWDEYPPFRPVTLPARGKVSRELLVIQTFSHDAGMEFLRCKQFCVTAVVYDLKLKSNTVFFNGFFDLGPTYDPFQDVAELRRRAAEERERERAEFRRWLKEVRKHKRPR